MLRLAARKLPKAVQADQLEEWSANVLDEIYADAPGMPLTRLVRGMRFATSAWWGARRLARELDPSAPRTMWGVYRRLCARWGIAAGEWSRRRGHPRVVSHVISYAVAGLVVDAGFGIAISAVWALDHSWQHAVVVGLTFALCNMLVQSCGQGAAASLLEVGRQRRWSAHRIYLTYQMPLDMIVPYSGLAAVVITSGAFSWWLPLIWVVSGSVQFATNCWFARKPARLRVHNPLLPPPVAD